MLSLILLTLLVNIVGIYKTAKGETSLAIGCFFFGGLSYGASIMLDRSGKVALKDIILNNTGP